MTTKMTRFLTLLAATAMMSAPLAAQGFARAQAADRDPIERFMEADTNGDGVVTRAEFNAARMARFDKLDRNGDGTISRADFGRLMRLAPRLARRIDALLADADSNYDGRVSRAEYAAMPMPLFDRLDRNRDGKVDRQELEAARAHIEAIREELETYRNLR